MDKKIKVGVMGVTRGIFALMAGEVLSDEMVITAVCETNEKVIENAKKHFAEETKVYSDFDEFISSGIDAVVLANFFHEHVPYAIKAMRKGVAVLCETTAAPTLGECVDLVEAAEKYNGRYMLAANCPFFKAVHLMKKKLESGEYGRVYYGEAEYIHPNQVYKEFDTKNLHWRQTMPNCYYNMHSLGPLMYVTNSVPVSVTAKGVCAPESCQGKVTDLAGSWALTEMDNGAVFNTTGCLAFGVRSKWFRLGCQHGTMETVRYDETEATLVESKKFDQVTQTIPGWSGSGVITEEQEALYYDKIDGLGHGGIDFVMMIHFLKFVRGEEEPFFDVYRAAALSAAGILSWYSILDGKTYKIPDFHDKEAREIFRGDYRMPIAKDVDELTMTCKMKD